MEFDQDQHFGPVNPRTGGSSPERWARITDLLGDALDLPPESRPAFLAGLHISDADLADEVRSLLLEHERPGDFLPELPDCKPAGDLRGRSVGAYRLTRLLGSGGMGTVYLAERSDGSFARHVAVKLLSPAFSDASDWFQRERELLARLDHPNIARLLDGGTTPEGWPYLVMEYVEGVPIDRYCNESDLGLDDRLQLLLQVCAGLAHAHQRLVIHCDVKPGNILVTSEGTVKLLDFGIAKLVDPEKTATLWRPGTPAYSSPEQLRGETLTTASDVYSLGVLAYVLLTGQWPYSARSGGFHEAVQAVLDGEAIAASRMPGLPAARAKRLRGDLDNVLARAVAKDPARRYASVQQLGDDLDSFRRGFPVRARADTWSYRLARFVRRHRVATALSMAALVLIVAAALVSYRQARIAGRRFEDLRAFAHAVVFDVNDAMATTPGTVAARKLLVETALRYLDRLAQERSTDAALREELAAAYIRVARVQGGAFLPNLGDTSGAVASFKKAIAAAGSAPATPTLARLGTEAHLSIAQLATDPLQGAPDFTRAIETGIAQLTRDPSDIETLRLVARAYHGMATIGHLTDNVPEHEEAVGPAVEFRERVVAILPDSWRDQIELAREYAQQALALAQKGDPASAVNVLARARALLADAHQRLPDNQLITRGLAELSSRSVTPLLLLDRIPEAEAQAETAMQLLAPLVASDANNQEYRSDLAGAWLSLASVRRAQGRLTDAIELARQTLAVRRARAARDGTLMFVPWGLSTILNTVGEMLMEQSPANWREARQLFTEARDVAERRLAVAPSFNELRKELATSYEGLARTALAAGGPDIADARLMLEQSLAVWNDVLTRSIGDRRQADRPDRVRELLSSLPADGD